MTHLSVGSNFKGRLVLNDVRDGKKVASAFALASEGFHNVLQRLLGFSTGCSNLQKQFVHNKNSHIMDLAILFIDA